MTSPTSPRLTCAAMDADEGLLARHRTVFDTLITFPSELGPVTFSHWAVDPERALCTACGTFVVQTSNREKIDGQVLIAHQAECHGS